MSTGASPRVPPELSDRIIDCFSPPPLTDAYNPDEEEDNRVRALCACIQVCRNWFPRAQHHLYSTAWVSDKTQLDKLCRTLQASDHLIRGVTRFVVAPRTWRSLQTPVQGFLRFKYFFSVGCPIQHIVFSNFLWDDTQFPPHQFINFMPSTNTIVRLQYSGALLYSFADLLKHLRCFPRLSHLALLGVDFYHKSPSAEVIRLRTARPCWTPTLRILEVGGQGVGIPGLDLLGSHIEHFRAVVAIGSAPHPYLSHFRDCVSNYQSLKSLRVTLQPWVSLKLPVVTGVREEDRVWGPVHDYLLSFIGAVRAPSVHTLKIAVMAQQRDEEKIQEVEDPETEDTTEAKPWDDLFRYRATRLGLLDILFASDVRDLLASPTFANLTTLELVISDNSPKHDVSWWKLAVAKRLSDLPRVSILADVKRSIGREYDALWERDPVLPITASVTLAGEGVHEG